MQVRSKVIGHLPFIKILPEQDTRLRKLYSSHLEISISKILLPKRSNAIGISIGMGQKIPILGGSHDHDIEQGFLRTASALEKRPVRTD